MRPRPDFAMPGRGWREIASRLAHMDRQEFLDRSRQELAKRADAVLARCGPEFAPELAPAETVRPGRFFFAPGSVKSVLDLLRQRLPQQVEQIIRQADKICRHQFDLLGYEGLEYGNPIHWHFDRVHGREAPRKPFHKIRYL